VPELQPFGFSNMTPEWSLMDRFWTKELPKTRACQLKLPQACSCGVKRLACSPLVTCYNLVGGGYDDLANHPGGNV
jgi:hypothetical protein